MASRDDPLMLGLDAGTTRVRALVFAPDGTLVAEGSAPTPLDYPQPGWADYDPADLWAAAVAALRGATAQLDDPRRIVGLAAASVGESAVPIDAADRPTSRAIAWFDKRTEDQVAFLERTIGLEALSLRTGMRLEPIGGLCKMLWFREHEPEAFARTRIWLHIAEFLAWKLSGQAATDHSLASRTLAMDIKTLAWADDLLDELGIPDGLFQPLAAAGTPLGPVTAEAAAETGLPETCTVAVGGHDHILGALVIGALAPGALLDSLGTAEALLFARDAPLTDPQLARDGYAQGVLVIEKPLYYFLGGLFTSGACVDWFRRELADNAGHAELIAAGEAVPPGSIGVHFLPHFRIGSPPFPGGAARGAFFGLSTDVTRAELYRALLEGLAYDAHGIVDGMLALSPETAGDRILATGGESRNALLMRIKASVYDRPIEIVEQPEAVSLGAALLGGLAAGVYDSLDAALAAVRPASHTVAPEPDWVPLYADRFANVFRPAHRALAPLYEAAQRDV